MKKKYIVKIVSEKQQEFASLLKDNINNNAYELKDQSLIIAGEESEIRQRSESIRLLMLQLDQSSELVEEIDTPMYRKILFLQGLDCANCAAKIERIARRNLNHESITVDFATSRMIVETKSDTLKKTLIKDIQSIAS